MSYIDFNQRKWVRNRVWRRSFLNNQSLLPVYKSSFQIAVIFENLLKDFNLDFIRFQILKNFTVQLSRLRFTTADEWDGKGDIVRDAAIFREFRGFKNYPWSNNCTNPIRRISSARFLTKMAQFRWPGLFVKHVYRVFDSQESGYEINYSLESKVDVAFSSGFKIYPV